MRKNPKENLDEWVNRIALKARLHLLSGKIIFQQQIR